MPQFADIPRVAMQVTRGVVVASIQIDLEDGVVARFRDDLLGRVHETGARGVILDVSGLETLDSEEFEALRRVAIMVRLLGAETVVAGIRPGIVSSLIEVGVELDGLCAAIDLDAAFAALEEPDPDDEAVDPEMEGPPVEMPPAAEPAGVTEP